MGEQDDAYCMDAITNVPAPVNEPVLTYAPNTPERDRLTTALGELSASPIDLPHVIGGVRRMSEGERIDVVQPHNHRAVLGTVTNAGHAEAGDAVEAAVAAKNDWAALSFDDRAAVFPASRRSAVRSVAGHPECRHHAGAVENRVSG